MDKNKQLIERFLEMQDHPELLTDKQLQRALNDPQMRELVEQMAQTKRAFVGKEPQAEQPDVEFEWQKFAEEHTDELNALDDDTDRKTQIATIRHLMGRMPYKIAASFIGIILAAGMAFAAIHIVRTVTKQQPQTVQTEQPMTAELPAALSADTNKTDTIATAEPVVFDNVPLEKMLPEIAAYYHAEVSFQSDEARQLRFHFVWKPEDGLPHAIDKLNRFESLTVRLDGNRIIVE